MLHSWNKTTDGNGSTNRVMLFDFRKAFDMIDRGAGISIIARADIHIFVFTDCKNNRFQKKLIGQNTNI
jgi:hypothetical protein